MLHVIALTADQLIPHKVRMLRIIIDISGADDMLQRADGEFRTSDVATVKIFTHRERRQIHNTLTNERHYENLTVDVDAFNKTFTLLLRLNRCVLAPALPILHTSVKSTKNLTFRKIRTVS